MGGMVILAPDADDAESCFPDGSSARKNPDVHSPTPTGHAWYAYPTPSPLRAIISYSVLSSGVTPND